LTIIIPVEMKCMEEEYQWAAEVKGSAPGTMQMVRIGGNTILLVNIEGKFYATSNFCTHNKCYLHNGKLKGKILTCPCHSAQFDVTTGAVLAPPAKEPLPMYPVKVEGDGIHVQI
jgi:nitrite reductase/ring-hydroxylating ferredoxin subunit